ncbi:MAG: sigma-70 family RNA polymerase sigma factor [Aristaeellaceae bacterium]
MQTAPQSVVQKEATLTRLMETYGTNVLRVCFLYLHDHALAQDAAQTTFMKAWQALDTLREGATEKAWVMRIAANTCRSILRSREYRHYAHGSNLEDVDEPSVDALIPDSTVYNAVCALPDKYREIVILHYYQTLPIADVAQVLHIPQSSVRTRLHRARKLLEPMLKGWYLSDE